MLLSSDLQADVAAEVVCQLVLFASRHRELVVGANKAGLSLGGQVRSVDVGIWRAKDALPHLDRARREPPLLAVEIEGAGRRADHQDAVSWLLGHGVPTVWLVQPSRREVTVATSDTVITWRAFQLLPAPLHLPGLNPSVASLFAPLDRLRKE